MTASIDPVVATVWLWGYAIALFVVIAGFDWWLKLWRKFTSGEGRESLRSPW